MPLVVGTNTSAQFAQDALRANQNKIATAMQRLSTGLRINSARDDAAGLAISQSMTSQIRGLNQAVRNINDGVNLLQTAEGGLGSITDMLQRMRELAVQSANGTNSDAQRAYLQKEAAALQEQISKIADTTTWNDKKLLDGSFTGQKIQVGADSGATIDVSIASPIQASTAEHEKAWTKLWGSSGDVEALTTGLDGSIYVSGYTEGDLDGQTNSGSGDAFLTKYSPDGTKTWTKLLGTSSYEHANALTTGLDGSIYVSGYTEGDLDGQTNSGGYGDAFLTKYSPDGTKTWTKLLGMSADNRKTVLTTGLDGSIYVRGFTDELGPFGQMWDAFLTKYSADGTKAWTKLLNTNAPDIAVGLTAGLDGSIYVSGRTDDVLDGQTIGGRLDPFLAKYSADGTKVWAKPLSTVNTVEPRALTTGLDGSIYVSGTQHDGQNFSIIHGMFLTKYVVPSFSVDISTQVGASTAIGLIDNNLDAVNSARSTIGSYINRLSYAADNATNISTNLAASRSTIMDADYAEESANLAKSQIVQQAATAMLSQANQQPQSVLALLKNL